MAAFEPQGEAGTVLQSYYYTYFGTVLQILYNIFAWCHYHFDHEHKVPAHPLLPALLQRPSDNQAEHSPTRLLPPPPPSSSALSLGAHPCLAGRRLAARAAEPHLGKVGRRRPRPPGRQRLQIRDRVGRAVRGKVDLQHTKRARNRGPREAGGRRAPVARLQLQGR